MQIRAVQRQSESSCENPAEDPLCNSIYDRREFTHRLISQVQVDVPVAKTFVSNERHSAINAEDLSDRWNISLAQAQQTLKVTTQPRIRSASLPLSRRYRADRIYDKKCIRGSMYTDTMDDARCKSLDGNKYAQVFTNRSFFVATYPMEKKNLAGDALRRFTNEYGVPDKLIFDGSGEQTGKNTDFIHEEYQTL